MSTAVADPAVCRRCRDRAARRRTLRLLAAAVLADWAAAAAWAALVDRRSR